MARRYVKNERQGNTLQATALVNEVYLRLVDVTKVVGRSYKTLEREPPCFPRFSFGHGDPMNALSENVYTSAWRRIGMATPKPRAILSVSAYWFQPGTGVPVS